jgi:LmbE family N-acetylglucosaminyl deacetylase
LLAHPDDDLFLRPLLLDERVEHLVVYLTNGRVPGPTTPEQRQQEAHAALAEMGVDRIAWLGVEEDIDVYALIHQLEKAYSGLLSIVERVARIRRVVTHAWEGGHPDHDAAHILAQALARRAGVERESVTLPYYRASTSGLAPFVVMATLPGNGTVHRRKLSWKEAWSIIWGMRWYPSQTIPLLGLGPGAVFKSLAGRALQLQALSASAAPERPHEGKMLYEKRNGITYGEVRRRCDAFLTAAPDLRASMADNVSGHDAPPLNYEGPSR